jgi:hypothetical protein
LFGLYIFLYIYQIILQNVSGVGHQLVLANERMITRRKGQGEVDYNGMETDELAMVLLPRDSDTYRAFKTKGDGNCL